LVAALEKGNMGEQRNTGRDALTNHKVRGWNIDRGGGEREDRKIPGTNERQKKEGEASSQKKRGPGQTRAFSKDKNGRDFKKEGGIGEGSHEGVTKRRGSNAPRKGVGITHHASLVGNLHEGRGGARDARS